jgi:hypothetical protein
MHYQQGGEICIQFITRGRDAFCKGESLHQGVKKRDTQFRGRTWVFMHLFRGSLHSCFGSSVCRLNLLCTLLFCRWCRALLPHLEESAVWSILSRLCWAVALALGDWDLLFQVIFLCFCLAFDHLFEIFVRFFSFSFSYELVTMCVVNALIKGEIEDRSVWWPVDDRSLVWWVIDNVVWTDSWLSIAGAGCGLICVGASEERARKVLACVSSEEWRDK